MSRDPNSLIPDMQVKYKQFAELMKKNGFNFILTCAKRTPEEQAELYAQGRTKPGHIVTWTLNSRHLTGKAFDIAITDNKGKPVWDADAYQVPGRLGESIGLVWGGRWQKPDYPHFELPKVKGE